MKTIFIILDSGAAIRNILRTDVFRILKSQKDLRIVIFSPVVDEDFRQEFSADNVIIEPVPKWKPNPIVKIARSLRKDVWAEKTQIFTFLNRRKRKHRRFIRWFVLKLLSGVNNNKGYDFMINTLERLEQRFTPLVAIDTIKKYNPDIIFYTTLYAKDLAIELTAFKLKLKTICFIHSWDNPTSKGPFQVLPDRIIVWNEILKDELVRYHNYPEENIYICGVPQFDIYGEKDNFFPKEEFFRKGGLDPKKRLITYTTGTPGMLPDEHEVVEMLYKALKNNAFVYPSQLLVRLHPKDKLEYYKKFENLPDLVIQLPGRPAKTNDNWNPTHEDMYGLAELMNYSDVVINIASTITIDAVCFNTPVVNVAFDGYENKSYNSSCRRYYDYEHYRNILKTGGVRVANNLDELIKHVNDYLLNPSLDDEGRELIRKQQCWRLDGKSGQRIAECILDYLNN